MDIAVLAGGRSPEHDVSLSSVRQVLLHLDRARWRVWPVFLDRAGGFWPSRQPLAAHEVWQPGDQATSLGPLRPGAAIDWLLDHANVQAVFPVLHGPNGEDGTLQGMLELYELPCVGSGCAASAVAMDKLRTRDALLAAGVPMPRAYVPTVPFERASAASEFRALAAAVGTPAFVKVDASGSTVGVQRIEKEADLAAFFAQFQGRFRRWYAEQALVGEEITVGVLGNTGRSPRALPAIGIYPRVAKWFTHEAKYVKGASDEVIPPRGLSSTQLDEVGPLAVRCHEAIVCDGMSRTDMIVTADGPQVLEINSIPGLTETSLLPQAARAAGMSFPVLLDRLLDLALERAGRTGRPARPAAVEAATR